MITVRPEQAQDVEAIRHVNEHAFETPAEARLVDLLRARGKLVASLEAQVNDQAVGHIAFSLVSIAASPHYYPRFGFVPASRFGIRCAWEVPGDVFMALDLREQALAGSGGLALYEPEFDEV